MHITVHCGKPLPPISSRIAALSVPWLFTISSQTEAISFKISYVLLYCPESVRISTLPLVKASNCSRSSETLFAIPSVDSPASSASTLEARRNIETVLSVVVLLLSRKTTVLTQKGGQVFRPASHISKLDYCVSPDCIFTLFRGGQRNQYVTIQGVTVVTDSL